MCTMENYISYKIYLRVITIHMENFYHTMLWSKLDQIYTRGIDTEVKGDTDLQKKSSKMSLLLIMRQSLMVTSFFICSWVLQVFFNDYVFVFKIKCNKIYFKK